MSEALVNHDWPTGIHDGQPRTKVNGNITHTGDNEMPPRRVASDDEDRLDRIERLLERSLSEPRTNIQRSTDTLRRDIGIFAILLAMMAQTGAAFYWAGGVSRAQESGKETMQQVQSEQAYTRAQLQLIDGKLQKIEGKQEAERDKRNGR